MYLLIFLHGIFLYLFLFCFFRFSSVSSDRLHSCSVTISTNVCSAVCYQVWTQFGT